MTKQTKLFVAAAFAISIAVLLIFTKSLGERSSSAEKSPSAQAPASADGNAGSRTAKVTALQSEAKSPKPVTVDHHQKIRTNARTLNQATQQRIDGTLPETTTEELAEMQQAEMEKRLIESMAALTEQIKKDPAFATKAIAMLQAEDDPEIMLLLAQAIGQAAEALGDKFPADALLKLAEADNSLDRRRAALVAMGYMQNPPLEVQRRMATLTQSGPTPEIRIAAIEGMGAWGVNNPDMAQRVSESLLAAREATDDSNVRGMVIQTIGNLEQPLTPKVLEAMADAIRNEPEPVNRSRAALALGGGIHPGNRESVLQALEQAYLSEEKIDTRRHIITQITKAARYDAEDYLTRLPAPHPLLAQDIEDYVQILASVDRGNWGQIWDRKSELDHQRNTYPNAHGGHGSETN